MKFVIDGMLGGLARWLRMLGYDTSYDSHADDNTLLVLSQQEGTVLLTSDEELHNRARTRGILSVFVLGETEKVRLAQLARSLGIPLEIEMSSTRCPECGSTLREISKEEASDSVPVTSLRLYERFWRCKGMDCGKTYWMGSHWKNILQTLEEARLISKEG